jgi:hypothetical protein
MNREWTRRRPTHVRIQPRPTLRAEERVRTRQTRETSIQRKRSYVGYELSARHRKMDASNSLGSRAIQHWAMATSSSPAPGIDEISNERATAAICRDSQVKLYGCGGRRRRASGEDQDKRRRALRARVGRHVSTLGAIYSRLLRHRMLRLDRRASRVLRRSRRHTKKKDDRIGIHKRKWPHEQAVLIISRPTLYVAAQAYAHHTLSPLSHPLGQVVQRVSSASTPR